MIECAKARAALRASANRVQPCMFSPVVSLIGGLHVECASQSSDLRSKDSVTPKAERLSLFLFPPLLGGRDGSRHGPKTHASRSEGDRPSRATEFFSSD